MKKNAAKSKTHGKALVFTLRGERVRLISARIAERDEERIYEQNN